MKQEGLKEETKQTIVDMILHMTNEEKIWTKHISKDLLGFTDNSIDLYIEYQANSVCNNIGIDPLFEETDGGPISNLVKENSMLTKSSGSTIIATKTNFFENAVGDYSKNSIDDDY